MTHDDFTTALMRRDAAGEPLWSRHYREATRRDQEVHSAYLQAYHDIEVTEIRDDQRTSSVDAGTRKLADKLGVDVPADEDERLWSEWFARFHS